MSASSHTKCSRKDAGEEAQSPKDGGPGRLKLYIAISKPVPGVNLFLGAPDEVRQNSAGDGYHIAQIRCEQPPEQRIAALGILTTNEPEDEDPSKHNKIESDLPPRDRLLILQDLEALWRELRRRILGLARTRPPHLLVLELAIPFKLLLLLPRGLLCLCWWGQGSDWCLCRCRILLLLLHDGDRLIPPVAAQEAGRLLAGGALRIPLLGHHVHTLLKRCEGDEANDENKDPADEEVWADPLHEAPHQRPRGREGLQSECQVEVDEGPISDGVPRDHVDTSDRDGAAEDCHIREGNCQLLGEIHHPDVCRHKNSPCANAPSSSNKLRDCNEDKAHNVPLR